MRRAICSAVTATTLLILTGCASQDNTSTSSAASSTAKVKVDYKVAASYTGGTLGKADSSLTPVTIGWVNEQGGTSSTPEATSGLNAAVKLVNERLGGINGHPLKVRSCFVKSSAEEGQACAQDMYNDSKVNIVLTGATSLAAEPLHSVLGKKKPVLGSTPSGSSDLTAANAYYTGPGPFGTAAHITYVSQYLHAKKVSVIAPAFPGTTIALQQLKKAAKKEGATLTVGTYELGSSDVTPAVAASGARTADAVLVLDPTTTGCISISKALSSYSIAAPVISNSNCATDEVAAGLSGELPKWTFAMSTLVPSMSVTSPSNETAVFLAAMKKYEPKSTVFGLSAASFSLVLYLNRIMNQLGAEHLSSSELSSALAKSKGPVFLSTPTLKFGTTTAPAIGSLAARYYTYQGKGTWKAAAKGLWLT